VDIAQVAAKLSDDKIEEQISVVGAKLDETNKNIGDVGAKVAGAQVAAKQSDDKIEEKISVVGAKLDETNKNVGNVGTKMDSAQVAAKQSDHQIQAKLDTLLTRTAVVAVVLDGHWNPTTPVHIKTAHGGYLCATSDNHGQLKGRSMTTADSVFQLQKRGGPYWALFHEGTQNYVRCLPQKNRSITDAILTRIYPAVGANTAHDNGWEWFRFISGRDGTTDFFYIQSIHDTYLSARDQNERSVVDVQPHMASWELFQICFARVN